ncbi:MAG: ABC transporter substrate-binding protein [Chloroflexota bacterium]
MKRLPAVLSSALVLAACGGSAQPAAPASSAPPASGQLVSMTIPYSAISVSTIPLWIAVDTGLFAKYGLDVKVEYLSSGVTTAQQLVAGQIGVADAGAEVAVSSDLGGADLVVVAPGISKPLFAVFGTSSVQTVADLKGKRVGISKIGASPDFMGRYVVSRNKLDPGKDVAFLQMGDVPGILAGMQSGAVDAGVLSPPTSSRAKQLGLKELANLTDYDLAFYQQALLSRRSWIKEHHADALNVMRAFEAGVAVALRDKAAATKVLAKYAKIDDQAILDDSYAQLLKALQRDQAPKPEAIKESLNESENPAAKTADPATFIDPSLVDELTKSGFVDSLYK